MYRCILVTVPPQTSAETPLRTTVKLTKGTLYQVTIQSPPGPNWEVYTRVLYREHSLIPVDKNLWVPLEEHTIEVLLNWNDWDGTYTLFVDCCSPDARFSHDILFSFEIIEQATLIDVFLDFIAKGF